MNLRKLFDIVHFSLLGCLVGCAVVAFFIYASTASSCDPTPTSTPEVTLTSSSAGVTVSQAPIVVSANGFGVGSTSIVELIVSPSWHRTYTVGVDALPFRATVRDEDHKPIGIVVVSLKDGKIVLEVE